MTVYRTIRPYRCYRHFYNQSDGTFPPFGISLNPNFSRHFRLSFLPNFPAIFNIISTKISRHFQLFSTELSRHFQYHFYQTFPPFSITFLPNFPAILNICRMFPMSCLNCGEHPPKRKKKNIIGKGGKRSRHLGNIFGG